MRWRVLGVLAVLAVGVGLGMAARDAGAQRIDPRRPNVFVVGAPPGASPMHRVDARRSGVTKSALPSGTLHIAWRKTTGLSLDYGVLSGADGTIAIVSSRGDVTFLDEAGEERGTVKVGAAQVGPAAMTSDGTVVFVTSGGEAIGVRRSSPHPRFSTRIGGDRNVRSAPLALDDGGVVVATTTDLVVLDAQGNTRARVLLPELPAAALVAAGDKIIAVTLSGAVFGWTPGREPVRVGSFGAPVDGGVVLASSSSLIGVIEGNHLAEVDIARGGRTTLSIASQGIYLGPPSVRPSTNGPLSTLLALTPGRGFVVTLDASGQELLRAPIATMTPQILPDGGAPPLVAPAHTGPLVDGRGAVAFAATDGHVGVVGPDGAVDSIGEILCMKGTRSGVVGLTPLADGAFAVTCDSGVVVKVTGPAGDAQRRAVGPAAPPASGSATGPLRLRPGPRDPD